MVRCAEIILFILLSFQLCDLVHAQKSRPERTPPIVFDEEFECGLVQVEPTKLNVSVWNYKDKKFVNDLEYTDFKIFVNERVQFVDYFFKPSLDGGLDKSANEYVLGTVLYDFYKPGWYSVKVKLKRSKDHFNVIVKAPKRIYINN